MNEQRHTPQPLPEPTLRRLPWYLAYVERLDALGIEHVSSTSMSRSLNVDAAQIAKDLSMLNIRGKTRIGYHVPVIVQALTDVLRFHRQHQAVVLGAGSLGRALMQDDGLKRYGLHIIAGFDIDHRLEGKTIGNTPIHHIDQLPKLQPQLNADIAIISVPVEHSQSVAQLAVENGIKAIWNFTPIKLVCPPNIVVANTSIYADLTMIYNGIANVIS